MNRGEKREQMYATVEKWRQSGQTQKEFALNNGVNL